MIVVDWSTNVNQRILRSSNWNMPTKFIADKTRCGAKKVRMANNLEPRKFSIKMRFNPSEKEHFVSWFVNVTLGGTLAFWFPDITKETNKVLAYRFTEGSVSFANVGGTYTDVTMTWESVEGVVKDE